MEFVTTFIDKDGYVMAFRVKASSEEDAWEIGRDRAERTSHTDDLARFKIESGSLTSEGWIPSVPVRPT